MAQDIPFEIVDYILSNFKKDKKTLSSFTTVSRLWSDVARPLLFASITLTSPARSDASPAKASLSHTTLDDFIEQHPLLAGSVKEMFFRYPSKPLNMVSLSATLTRLPQLRTIVFDGVSFTDSPSHEATHPAPIRFARIEATHLYHIKSHPHPLSILFKYLAADAFTWDHSNHEELTADDFLEQLDRQPITDLVMTTTATTIADFEFFSRYLVPRSLRVLTVNLVVRAAGLRMCRFLDEAGQNLVCLQVELVWLLAYHQFERGAIDNDPNMVWTLMGSSISKLTRLETLRISVPVCRSKHLWTTDDFSQRYAVFKQVFSPTYDPSPRLRVLSICFVEQERMLLDKNAVEMWGIDALNSWAAPRQCRNLDCVEVQVDVQSWYEDEGWENVDPTEVRKAVKGALPDLAEAGRLRIAGLGHAKTCV